MDFFINNIYTILFVPIWIFLLIVIGRFFNTVQSKKVIAGLTLLSTMYGLIFAIGTFLYLLKTPDYVFEQSYTFLSMGDLSLNLGIFIDNLSVIFLLVVCTISLIVQYYSTKYMRKDKSFPRFFGYLNLFNFSMLGLVLSPNIFQTYIFWELVGVSSYLLIGFWYKKPSASHAAKKAFIMNRIGDVGLLAGVIALSYFMYQYTSDNSLATIPFANINDVANYLYSYTSNAIYIGICILLLMGAFAKSAQFPLHTWLPDAMEAPTPVSALIHSATMVAAGVYLVARLYPIFSQSEGVMYFIATIGLITALIGAFIAMSQNDLKRILAYSTSSQLGLMFVALGCGAYAGGLFHFITHAFFKSMLFLCAGIIIGTVSQNDIRFMGGLRKVMPLTAICYFIGCISASGIYFSGFYSKDMILKFLFENRHETFAIGFLIVAFMTTFYLFRTYFKVFEGNFKGEEIDESKNHTLNISISLLVVFTMILGLILNRNISQFVQSGTILPQVRNCNPAFISLTVSLVAFVIAYLLYNTKFKSFRIPVLYNLSYNKLYIDDFYNFIANKVYYSISNSCAFIDKYLVDGIVKLSALCVRGFSWILSKLQSGNFQSYLAYTAVFLACIFTALMLAYNIIISLGVPQ
jgi:proton-translocating NADH-quinone oxidoreductase chain L